MLPTILLWLTVDTRNTSLMPCQFDFWINYFFGELRIWLKRLCFFLILPSSYFLMSFHLYTQVLDANKCFEKQRHSALSLQLAAYYYSLQIYSLLTPCFKNKNHTLYQVSMKHQLCILYVLVVEWMMVLLRLLYLGGSTPPTFLLHATRDTKMLV